jgi:hypothetical protein
MKLGYQLGTMRAALRGQRYIAEALRAQLVFGRCDGRGVKLGHQGVDRHHHQEVKGSGNEDKCDEDVEKLTVLDDAAVDVDHQEGKIRLVHDSRDEGIDDISNQRANNRCKCGADHNCDRKIDYVAAQDKVAKSFKHGVLLIWEFTRPVCPKILLEALCRGELEGEHGDVVFLAKGLRVAGDFLRR